MGQQLETRAKCGRVEMHLYQVNLSEWQSTHFNPDLQVETLVRDGEVRWDYSLIWQTCPLLLLTIAGGIILTCDSDTGQRDSLSLSVVRLQMSLPWTSTLIVVSPGCRCCYWSGSTMGQISSSFYSSSLHTALPKADFSTKITVVFVYFFVRS